MNYFVSLKSELRGLISRSQLPLWLMAVGIAALIAFLWDHGRNTEIQTPKENPASAATFIPPGYVLVPIEVANYESLDSILGQYGVVDLYKSLDEHGGHSIKVAEHIRILRAPLNPSHFAVLARESESQNLVRYSGAYTVVVQNPNSTGTKIVKDDSQTDSEFEGGQKHASHSISRIRVEVQDAGKGI